MNMCEHGQSIKQQQRDGDSLDSRFQQTVVRVVVISCGKIVIM